MAFTVNFRGLYMQKNRNRTIKIAFYRAKHGTWIDALVALFTWGKFSHVEIIFEDGLSISASPRDGGVRSKFIIFDADKWQFIRFEVSSIEYNNIRKYVVYTLRGVKH